jgi:formate-dependent nitrite reductase membrane component NrfD
MIVLAESEHFVRAPNWTWYILFYFFLAGLSGGSYTLATLLRLRGGPEDEAAARVGYYLAFPTLLLCPVLLTLDLGQPLRFWHMLVDTTPGGAAPIFKYWSPMSVGSWVLVVFSVFAGVSFLDALVRDRTGRGASAGGVGALARLWSLVGAVVGLFVAGYTGVLLAVSNQPVWSDTWALGGLFLASGLSGSAALLGWLVRFRRDARASAAGFVRAERFFLLLELALIVALVVTLIPAGTLGRAFGFPWILLWLVALACFLPWLPIRGGTRLAVAGDGSAAETTAAVPARAAVAAPGLLLTALVLVSVLAIRAAVIFSAQ